MIKRPLASYKHMETGERLIPALELEVLGQFYGLSKDEIAELEELRQRANRPSEYASFGLPEDVVIYLDMEREAHEIRTWQNLIIPGILQVEPYMRRLFELGGFAPNEIDQRVRARLKRQERLTGEQPVKLSVVIAEEALIRCAKIPVQVARLADFAEWDNIEIRMMPLHHGLHRGMDGSFTHLALGGAEDLVYDFAFQETASGSQLTDKPTTVRYLLTLFEELRSQALDVTESLTAISRLVRHHN